jgi:predicted  nucleic acid-binding Zn-ribbon protein
MNKRQHNLNHRDYDSVQELFEEVVRLDDDIENTSEWIRQKKREYLMENGLDDSSADDLIRELEDEMREIEDEIRQKERKLEELKERKEKVRELAGSVELEQEGSDGGDESDEVKELRAKGYGIKKKGGGSD